MKFMSLLLLISFLYASCLWGFGYRDAYYGYSAQRHYKKGDFDQAKAALNRVRPQNAAEVQNNLGNIYLEKKNFTEAENAYLNAIQSSSGSQKSKALYNLGNTYYQKENYEQALDAYKQALTLRPKDKRIQKNMELVYSMMKIKKESKSNKNESNKKDKNKTKGSEKNEKGNKEGKNQKSPSPKKNTGDSEAILNAIERREKEVRAKYLNKPIKQKPVQYDW